MLKSLKKEKIEQKLEVSQPLYTIGIKDKIDNVENSNKTDIVKKHIAIEILL